MDKIIKIDNLKPPYKNHFFLAIFPANKIESTAIENDNMKLIESNHGQINIFI
jgi:hypothetical protein